MSRRIYAVLAGDNIVAMVAAGTQAAAIKHVIGDRYKASPASGIEVARFMTKGGKIDSAPQKGGAS